MLKFYGHLYLSWNGGNGNQGFDSRSLYRWIDRHISYFCHCYGKVTHGRKDPGRTHDREDTHKV